MYQVACVYFLQSLPPPSCSCGRKEKDSRPGPALLSLAAPCITAFVSLQISSVVVTKFSNICFFCFSEGPDRSTYLSQGRPTKNKLQWKLRTTLNRFCCMEFHGTTIMSLDEDRTPLPPCTEHAVVYCPPLIFAVQIFVQTQIFNGCPSDVGAGFFAFQFKILQTENPEFVFVPSALPPPCFLPGVREF